MRQAEICELIGNKTHMKIADTVCVTETYSTLKVTPQLFQVNYTRLTWTLSKD